MSDLGEGVRILCVAVLGPTGNPRYLRQFESSQGSLQHHYTVHTSLDVFDERMSSEKWGRSTYVGQLLAIETQKVFGFVSPTGSKLVLVTADEQGAIREAGVKQFFSHLHSLFVDAVKNPFAQIDERITSRSFDAAVSGLVDGVKS